MKAKNYKKITAPTTEAVMKRIYIYMKRMKPNLPWQLHNDRNKEITDIMGLLKKDQSLVEGVNQKLQEDGWKVEARIQEGFWVDFVSITIDKHE